MENILGLAASLGLSSWDQVSGYYKGKKGKEVVFLPEDSPCSLSKEEDLLGSNSCYKSSGTVAAAIGMEVGPIYCCGGLRGGGKKRGGSSTRLLVTALIYIKV